MATSSMTRTLNVQWRDIGKKPWYLLFTFTPPPMDDLTENFKPIAWQVIVARNTGWQPVVYNASFGFGQSTSRNGNMLLGSIQTPIIAEGQRVDLITVDRNVTAWAPPTGTVAPGNPIMAFNRTDTFQDMSVGTISADGHYDAVLFWEDVAPTIAIKGKLHPVLSVYCNTGFQKNEIVDAELMKDTPLWSGNLAKLGNATTLQFTLDEQGSPYLTQV